MRECHVTLGSSELEWFKVVTYPATPRSGYATSSGNIPNHPQAGHATSKLTSELILNSNKFLINKEA
jgi:hypothetical protein